MNKTNFITRIHNDCIQITTNIYFWLSSCILNIIISIINFREKEGCIKYPYNRVSASVFILSVRHYLVLVSILQVFFFLFSQAQQTNISRNILYSYPVNTKLTILLLYLPLYCLSQQFKHFFLKFYNQFINRILIILVSYTRKQFFKNMEILLTNELSKVFSTCF